jgi:glucose/arabinose dehydrogenase
VHSVVAPALWPYLSTMKSRLRKPLIIFVGILVVLGAGVAWIVRGNPSDRPIAATTGPTPLLVEADSERFPSVGLAKPIGWQAGGAPEPAAGLAVGRFAEGLDHPRTMLTLPNGDVLVAETNSPPRGGGGGVTGFFMKLFMGRVGAADPSPNRIVLLRDADGDGKAEQRFTFREKDMDSPSGMAWRGGKLYVANHNAVLAFDFTPGATSLDGAPTKLMDLPGGGNHWMRNLLVSPDGNKLYVAVGSASNIAENGIEAEAGRAAIWEIDLPTGSRRQYAGGLRNPNGMDWNPSTGELWTVVNERNLLGPDLVPDYLTNVPVGAQYGWPWVYWKDVMDWRVKAPMPQFLIEYTRKPEYALGAHTAALGLLFSNGGNVMGDSFANGAFIARHGSWNRKPLVGYDVIFVPYDANGNPQGKPVPVLTGFLTDKNNEARGRPVWLAWDQGGALLVSDDTGGMIWRVRAPNAQRSAAPAPVNVGSLPPQRSLSGDPNARLQGVLGEVRNEVPQR